MKPVSVKKVLILGSGGLKIGQAGEFDYSGSQAIKALKEEGIQTVLVNPNIATVQTDSSMADVVYLQPLNKTTLEKIIAKERPDAVFLSFGGQTALNLGLELDKQGIFKKYKVAVLGTSLQAIRQTEDRDLFKTHLASIGIKTARSAAVCTVDSALEAAREIGYPIMMRSGFSLGGLGSGRIDTEAQLKERAGQALSGAPQIRVKASSWPPLKRSTTKNTIASAPFRSQSRAILKSKENATSNSRSIPKMGTIA